MSIAAELQELTQNTAELDGIRSDIRNALVEQGIEASTHNFADFAGDVGSIYTMFPHMTLAHNIPINVGYTMIPTMTLIYNGEEI